MASFLQTDLLYTSVRERDIKYLAVPHSDFRQFHTGWRRMRQQLGELAREPYWRPFTSSLYRFWRRTATTPVSFSTASLLSPEAIRELRANLANCAELYPGLCSPALDLLNRVDRLITFAQNPLMDAFLAAHKQQEIPNRFLRSHSPCTGGTAMIIQHGDFLEAVYAELKARGLSGTVTPVSPNHLRAPYCYERVVLFGGAAVVDEFVFSAPRAPEIWVIYYDCFRGRWRPQPAFLDTQSQKAPARDEDSEEMESIRLLNFDISDHLPTAGPCQGADHEEVNARLFVLEGDTAVFLEAETTALVVDLEAEKGKTFARKAVTNIEPGMFVLLRTGGGGDYIVPIADVILGDMAAHARTLQRGWKSLLRQFVARNGMAETTVLLSRLGAPRANDYNVRHWMSDGSIRTWDYHDFEAVMKLIGLGDEAEKYWSVMGLIDRAHSKAGRQIRRQLLRQVSRSDLQSLERLGRMDFTVEFASDVRITAYRVTRVLPGPFGVPPSRCGRPFLLEE